MRCCFFFQAFVEVLLKPTFYAETEAILSLEEPEAHLHPQAIRALTSTINGIAAQKIVSTHSPYVLQNVPIESIRLFRRMPDGTSVRYVKRAFSVRIAKTDDLVEFCAKNSAKYDYNETEELLTVRSPVAEKEYRKIATIYAKSKEAQAAIKQLRDESQLYIPDSDIADLDTYAKRVRGEIFFARGWLLCEGQTEYLLLPYFAELLGTPLDSNGISVIDFQNNGSPGAFVALARNLEIPWLLVCDHDEAGMKYVETVKGLGLSTVEATDLLRTLPRKDDDLELFLVTNGFRKECEDILANRGVVLKSKPGDVGYDEEVAENLRHRKTEGGTDLIKMLRESGADHSRVPPFFAQAIRDMVTKAS